MNKDLPSTTATGNTVRQIIENEDTVAKEANDVETEQITVEEMGQEMSENPESITPNFHTNDVEIMRQNILRELGIVQNIEMNKREILHQIQSNKNTKLKMKTANIALKEILKMRKPNLSELNNLIYAAAKVVTEECTGSKKRKDNKRRKPIWKEKIEKEIEQMRGDLSIISELQRGIDVKGRKCRRMIKVHQLTKENIASVKETTKQKMQLKAQRIRRYERRSKFYRQNMIFKTDARKFYREVGKEKVAVKDTPPIEKVEEFWKGIWSNDRPFNEKAEWIKAIEEGKEHIEEQQWIDISTEEVEMALKKSHKWKSAGVDKITNFWLHSLSCTHDLLAVLLSEVVRNPENTPDWLSEGLTYLLPKTTETYQPKNYRPITCLSTIYKLLTSIITDRTYAFIESNDLFPIEQKGCKRGSYGCKDQLLINRMVIENCKSRHRTLSMAWIDYRKAFDSVPHNWIIKTLQLQKISSIIINLLKVNMSFWKTNLILSHENGTLRSNPIDVKCGIFQGDSLSPLIFCLALAPLSQILNDTGYGYKIHNRNINHLFYMDDLKLFAKNDNELEGMLQTVKKFSDDIGMTFGLDKCAKASFKRGKLTKSTSLELDRITIIRDLDQEEFYKYLGVNECDGIQHSQMKEMIRKECYRRVRAILKTELNSANRIEAINTLAIPVVTYSFNIVNWTLSDIKKIDTKIRKLMSCNRMHHPKADVDRLYIPRKDGGRGLIQLELSLKTATIGLQRYLETTKDWMLQLVNTHEETKRMHSVKKESSKFAVELNIETSMDVDLPSSIQAKNLKKKAKQEGLKKILETWKGKPLHGQYPKRSQQADVDQEKTHQWLRATGLKAETEGFIIAAQDQSLPTRNYQSKIVKNGVSPKCRFCDQYDETIDHLVSGCPILTPKEYKARHYRVGQYLHWTICKHYDMSHSAKWYKHKTPPVVEGENITILWDFSIHTDRSIQANRPDIVIKDHKNKTCFLVDMAIPTDRNISIKEFDKLSKYKDLQIEMERMWHLKTTVIPIVVGALGMVKRGIHNHLKSLPGEPRLQEIQKIVLTSTAHILRKALSI